MADPRRALPPLRRRVFLAYILIVAVYAAALAAFVLTSLAADAQLFQKILTRNYDSIKAAAQLRRDWDARPFTAAARADLEHELRFARANITEPGEPEAVAALEGAWARRRLAAPSPAVNADFDSGLAALVRVNEAGMRRLAEEASREDRRELWGVGLFGLATLVLTLLIARRLARRLARPIIQTASELSRPLSLDAPLRLPPSGSREMEVLHTRLMEWWEQARRAQSVNVGEILAQRNRLEAVFASVEDAVILIDGSGTVSQMNGRARELLGAGPAALAGLPFAALARATANGRALLALGAPGGPGASAVEMDLGGRTRVFALRERGIPGPGAEAPARLLLLQDVTERRSRERLEDEFIGVLSHELKTPLQSLGMAAELMDKRRDRLDPGLAVFLDTILEDLARIRAVANDFVQVSQLNVRSIRLNLETVDLGEKLKEWTRPFELLAGERGVRVEVLGPEGGSPCRLDPVKFSWVASNLLSNALRVSAPGGTLRATVENQRLFVEMRVEDEGPGIPPELERRVFEPYVQGPDRSTAGLLGLGLTIAKEVVEAHEGALEYVRLAPRGSAFRVLLPIAAAPKEGAPR